MSGDTVTFTGQRCRDYQPTLDALKKAVKRKVYTYTEDRNGDVTVRVDTPFDLTKQTELEKASEPLRDYLKAHGGPHTSVIVTWDGATETQDERRVTFDSENPAETVNRNPDNACFLYTLPKDVVKAWSAIALEWHGISRAQKDGKECVKIYEKLVTDATIFQKNLKAALDEARQFPTV